MQNATRYRVLVKQGDTVVLSAYTYHTSYTPYYASSGSARTLANASYTWTIEAYNGSTLLYTTSSGIFDKAAPFELSEPQDGTSVASDPTLEWQVLQGANRYKVLILQGGTLIAQAYTEYPTYIPYYVSSGSEQVLAGGAYSWQVEAYNGSTLLTTSAIRTFNKGSSMGLVGPSDGAAVTADPTLQWEPLGDANRYKVLIYKGSTLYAYAFSRYTIYTPFYDASGSVEALPEGAYSWQVEAYYGSTLLTTSKIRTFTKTSSFGLVAPPDEATLAGDPTLQWHAVGDASRYKVLIYRNQVLVSYAFTEYPIYTPYNHGAGSVETLPDGSYTWKVEAYQASTLITTSPTQSFTIRAGAPTVTPTPSAVPTLTPTATATPSSADAFEMDNACGEAKLISSDGLPQTHSFHIWGDQDWLRFDATAGKTYIIQVSSTGPRADPVLFLYNTCGNASLSGADNAFGNDVSLQWNADVGGWYYLKVQQHDADTYGEGTNYDVSVTLDATPPEAPRNPRCASRSQDTIDVQWQQNSEPDAARYIINYHDELNNESGSRDVQGAATTYYSLNGLLFADRLYSMRIKAEDFSGNRGAESEEVSCRTTLPSDLSNPMVSLQQPTSGPEFTTSVGAISFMGSAQDLGNNLSRVRVANTANGAQGWDYDLSGGSASFSVADIALQPGDNPIQVDVMDEAGNVGSLGVTIHRSVEGGTLGAAIILGGHSETYSLQSNIDAVTNRTYEVFQNAGYDDERIYYLSPTPQDPDEDGASEVDAPTTSANLEAAIRSWAVAYVGPGRPLTLYLMDHGLIERFCSDGCNSGYTSPDDLDAALSDLEGSTGVEEINVIIEACHSGSFLDRQSGLGSISKAGRVLITSTDREHNAYASAQGAYFSDAFLTCVAGSGSISACFNQAKAAVGLAGVSQSPWIDDNGDGVSNPYDGTIAQSRYLAHLFGASPPVITDAEVLIDGASGTLTAQVSPGSDPVRVVWADIFAPSFHEPTGTTLNLGVPSVRLDEVATSPGLYRAAYPNGFAEPGRYRVVFYTQDRKGLQATPKLKVIGGGEVFLPMVLR